jgi:hypothetical protein
MANPAVAHKSKTAKNKFFIELLEINASRRDSQKLVLIVGLHCLDARRKPHVGELGQTLAVLRLF